MTVRNTLISITLLLASSAVSLAQQDQPATGTATSAPTVTISTTAKGIRVAALGAVRQIRLEVFGEGGDALYSSGFQAGNVRDWNLQDNQTSPLPDNSYLCVVTFHDVSGRVGVRYGRVLVRGGRSSVQLSEGELQAGSAGQENVPGAVPDDAPGALAVAAHDGREGQVTSTVGALTFRTGNVFRGEDKEQMRVTPEGRVGVGTDKPEATLDVVGSVRASEGFKFSDGTTLSAENGRLTMTDPSGGEVQVPNAAGTGTQNRLAKWTETGGAGTLTNSAVTESGGLVGVNNPNPATALDLVGTLTLRNTAGSAGYKVGDRVSDPSQQMVYGAAPGSAYSVLNTFVQGSTLGAPRLSQFSAWTSDIDLNPSNATQFLFRHDPMQGGVIGTVKYGAAAARGISIQPNWDGASVPTALVVGTDGNVGVGTSSPQARLHVSGNIRVTGDAVVDGNIAAKYQDIAEWVPTQQQLPAGTVVILDRTRINTVISSSRTYDTHVAGVVSAQPGMILGEGGEGKVMVATTGRVRVRVDATRHPIRVGDLLVTSERTGMAMRSRPVRAGGVLLHRPGTIIGKALEPLAKGEGEILVLLSLQ